MLQRKIVPEIGAFLLEQKKRALQGCFHSQNGWLWIWRGLLSRSIVEQVEGKRAGRLSKGKFSYFPILLRTCIVAPSIPTLKIILNLIAQIIYVCLHYFGRQLARWAVITWHFAQRPKDRVATDVLNGKQLVRFLNLILFKKHTHTILNNK